MPAKFVPIHENHNLLLAKRAQDARNPAQKGNEKKKSFETRGQWPGIIPIPLKGGKTN